MTAFDQSVIAIQNATSLLLPQANPAQPGPQAAPLATLLNQLGSNDRSIRNTALIQLGDRGFALQVGEGLAATPLLAHAARDQRFQIIGALMNHMVTHGGNAAANADATTAASQLRRVLTPTELDTFRNLDRTLVPRNE